MAVNNGREGRQLFVGKPWALQLALVAAMAVGGCSSVPKAVNPVEWAKSVGNVFSGDESDDQGDKQPIPGQDKAFPKLSDTPDPEAARARRPQTRGLVGDAGSQYSEPVARQGAPTNPLNPSGEAAPPAAPAVPVKPAAGEAAPAPEPPTVPASPPPAAAPAPVPAPAPAPAGAAPASPRAPSAAAPDPSPSAAVAPPPAPDIAPVQDAARQASATSGTRAAPPLATPREVAAPRSTAPAYPAADQTVVVSGDGVTFESDGQRSYAAATAPGRGGESGIPSAEGVSTAGLTQLATIQFGDGSAALGEADQKVLREVASIVNRRGGKRVLVIGHASSRTSDMDPVRHSMTNYEVSARRADAVAKALAGLGVKRDIIDARAAADQQPTYYETMPAGEAGNRRTDIYVAF